MPEHRETVSRRTGQKPGVWRGGGRVLCPEFINRHWVVIIKERGCYLAKSGAHWPEGRTFNAQTRTCMWKFSSISSTKVGAAEDTASLTGFYFTVCTEGSQSASLFKRLVAHFQAGWSLRSPRKRCVFRGVSSLRLLSLITGQAGYVSCYKADLCRRGSVSFYCSFIRKHIDLSRACVRVFICETFSSKTFTCGITG